MSTVPLAARPFQGWGAAISSGTPSLRGRNGLRHRLGIRQLGVLTGDVGRQEEVDAIDAGLAEEVPGGGVGGGDNQRDYHAFAGEKRCPGRADVGAAGRPDLRPVGSFAIRPQELRYCSRARAQSDQRMGLLEALVMTIETWRVLPRRVVSSATARLAGTMVTEVAGCLSEEHATRIGKRPSNQVGARPFL